MAEKKTNHGTYLKMLLGMSSLKASSTFIQNIFNCYANILLLRWFHLSNASESESSSPEMTILICRQVF